MVHFETMYEHTENANVCFVGLHSEFARYDFAIMYTNQFFGTPLVIDLKTGKAHLISAFDASNIAWITKAFQTNEEDAKALIQFFNRYIPKLAFISEI